MNAEETLKIMDMEREIREYLGQSSNHRINFNYDERDGLVRLFVETINPLYNQMFLFHHTVGTDKLDLRLFVDAHHDIKLERRLRRDVTERNISEETVRYQWENHVMPSYREYLEPYIQNADVVILNNHNFERSLQMVVNHMKVVLNQ